MALSIRCEDCGLEVKAQRSTRKVCAVCSKQRRILKAQSQEGQQKLIRATKRSQLVCRRCGLKIEALRSDAKWCPECRLVVHKLIEQNFEKHHKHPCPGCGLSIARTSAKCGSCSNPGRIAKITGPNNSAWKGGKTHSGGYVYVKVHPSAPKGQRHRAEHIVVWEQANGKPLPQDWVVHHLNHIKDDNRPENLEAMPRFRHNHVHGERRIRELELEVANLREQLDGFSGSQISP